VCGSSWLAGLSGSLIADRDKFSLFSEQSPFAGELSLDRSLRVKCCTAYAVSVEARVPRSSDRTRLAGETRAL